MKKELLLIAAAATMLTACVNTEDYRDLNIQQDSVNDGSIGFAPFAEKLTKAENSSALYTQSFLAHHSTFDVWGFKTGTNAGQVFGTALASGTSTVGTTVTVAGESLLAPTYTYSPLRFWDKSASAYYFFAVAPSKIGGNNWAKFHQGSTANTTGYFTADGVALNGVNLRDLAAATTYATGAPKATLENNFNGTTEIDRLIAAPCVVLPNRYNVANPDKVHLNFIHILSKLNVSIKKDAVLNDFTVTLKEFGVYYVPATGDFDESKADADGSGKIARWDLTNYKTSNVYDVTKKTNYIALNANSTYQTNGLPVTGTPNYIIESLVIPQNISYERVALDGGVHDATSEAVATYFTDYALYAAARPKEAPELTKAEFDELLPILFVNSGTAEAPVYNTLKTFDQYKANENYSTKTDADWKADLKKIENTPYRPAVAAYTAVANTSQPYFMIKYTITGGSGATEYTETFTSYYNLVAAFKNFDNDGHQSDGTTAIPDADKTLAFNEGWQNTLNITIKPKAIEFTADVAEWADTYNPSPIYDIK